MLGWAALALAFLQVLGGVIDLASGVWHVLALGHEFSREADFWLAGLAQCAFGIAWAGTGVALLRGSSPPMGRLVALVVLSTLVSVMEATYKLHGGDLDATQLLSIAIGLGVAVVLVTPAARGALGAAQHQGGDA